MDSSHVGVTCSVVAGTAVVQIEFVGDGQSSGSRLDRGTWSIGRSPSRLIAGAAGSRLDRGSWSIGRWPSRRGGGFWAGPRYMVGRPVVQSTGRRFYGWAAVHGRLAGRLIVGAAGCLRGSEAGGRAALVGVSCAGAGGGEVM